MRGADLLIQTLLELGVRRIFTLSGNHIMPVFDAAFGTPIELIHVRHEAAAVHMAEAWGRMTGTPGIALVTGGQGHTNALAALPNAVASDAPLILLSGHAPLSELGTGAFQEMPQVDLAKPLSKAAWAVARAENMAHDMHHAWQIALSGRAGPVCVCLPSDMLDAEVDSRKITAPPASLQATSIDVNSIVRALHGAARPLIIAGPWAAPGETRAQLSQLGSAMQAPALVMESPRGINDPAQGALAQVLAAADHVLLLQKPLDFTLKQGQAAPDAQWHVIDPAPSLRERATRLLGNKLVTSLDANGAAALAALTEATTQKALTINGLGPMPERSAWLEDAARKLAARPAVPANTGGAIHPAQMAEALASWFARTPEAVFICDGGEIGQWAQAFVRTDKRVINGVAGTIGAALPMAMAASLHHDAPVMMVMGDGTSGFHLGEFETAVRHRIPFIAVIGNDACWNAEHQLQLRAFGRDRTHGCDLTPARYDQVMTALGGFGAQVTRLEEIAQHMDAALAFTQTTRLPACVNIMIESVAAPVTRVP
jgi:acetolactate synthase I/II/III large subunit